MTGEIKTLKNGAKEISIDVNRIAEFGGFRVCRVVYTDTILVSAKTWKGTVQPRLFFIDGDEDWQTVLESRGRDVKETIKFAAIEDGEAGWYDQWVLNGDRDLWEASSNCKKWAMCGRGEIIRRKIGKKND